MENYPIRSTEPTIVIRRQAETEQYILYIDGEEVGRAGTLAEIANMISLSYA